MIADAKKAMVFMSHAIRGVLEKYAPTVQELPDEVLEDCEEIMTAIIGDLRGERERRKHNGKWTLN